VTVVDSLDSFGQANAYALRVADEPGTLQLYLGDLWYDVEVMLWRASMLPEDPSRWRAMPCDPAAGCAASAPPSARRRVQLVQPKVLLEPVEPGAYAVVVRPREEAGVGPGRPFTLRVAVTPPVCAVSRDPDDRYRAALAITPARPRRADLVTMTAYLLPPFVDLFDFEWSVDGRRLAATGPTAQGVAFELAAGPAGPQAGAPTIQVVARGARPYPDPDQPDLPPTLSVECPLTVS
jgi:hypothetical protein